MGSRDDEGERSLAVIADPTLAQRDVARRSKIWMLSSSEKVRQVQTEFHTYPLLS